MSLQSEINEVFKKLETDNNKSFNNKPFNNKINKNIVIQKSISNSSEPLAKEGNDLNG